MSKLRVGIIGTGKKKEKADRFGFAMAYRHAEAYKSLDSCEMAACADIVEENARAFAGEYGVKKVYTDYKKMLKEENLDMVSICTWMHLHESMVTDACRAGVKAIHCEKPMADTWGGAKRMAAAAEEADVQLTFNHMRRYSEPFFMAKEILDRGDIGELQRLETGVRNLYDTGTHFIDMFGFFNDESPAKWVMAQIDYRQEDRYFGSHNENQQVALIEYANGVYGLFMSAPENNPVGCQTRLLGTKGTIECACMDGTKLRYRLAGQTDWTTPDAGPSYANGTVHIGRAIADAIDCLQSGRKCQLDVSNALKATEIIFACYESSRRRGRIDLPLDIEDNPLAAMVENGDLNPAPDTGKA